MATEDLLENKDLTHMLEFETQIFLDVLHQDALVVAAKGLNLHYVLLNLFKVYCDPGNLILVLNSTENEEKFFVEQLNDENVHRTTFTTNTAEREDVYLSGGVHFITTRILVVDMLKNRIPIDKITGIFVLRAHNVLESCQEAFALRLYRLRNKTGFIKAFSNSAQSFTIGFGHIERVMRTVFVKELYLWPRFHATVIQSLKQKEPQVVELHIPLSKKMLQIQTCILDLMNLTVKELKRINRTVELQEITAENCLTKKFHKILQAQLDCIWNQLSSKSKQLIADLKTLRHLIVLMLYADPVTFYSTVCSYRTKEYAQNANWVFFQPAELLFSYANSLVFSGDKEFNPEFCPKWNSLSEILKVEIPNDLKKGGFQNGKVLILCQDNKTCYQLNHFLTHGPHNYLFSIALKHGIPFKTINPSFENCEVAQNATQNQTKLSQVSQDPKKPKIEAESKSEDGTKEEDGEFDFKCSYILTMSQTLTQSLNKSDSLLDSNETGEEEFVFEPFAEMENMDLTQLSEKAKSNPNPTILIQTFKGADNYVSLQKVFEDIQPNFVVLYQSNMTAIRQLELYEARRKKDRPMKVFFLIHSGTVEEQSYLTSLRREKEAFEFLIDLKSRMVIPEDQDGKSEECVALQRDLSTPEVNTRRGGKSETQTVKHFVIVDMREFRSELPALIHKRGVDIEPLTISVGDYILTNEICVERKSLSDLIGSLNSGRLYQQCVQMSRYYTKPMLLIEFDQNKPFSWQSNYMVSMDSNSFDIQQKLLLLTMHFPRLKIVWSPSPYASAQLFEELKMGKEQPDVQFALAIGGEQDLDKIESKYNSSVYDFVQKLPGITSKNIDAFLRQTKNMDHVIQMSEAELAKVLSSTADANTLFAAIHSEHVQAENTEQEKSKGKFRNKFKFVKGKK